jgi:ribosome maturation factor RimP
MSVARVISPELFNTVRKDVARYIKKKLKGMEIDVTDMELHNSSQTRTLRVYATLSRTTNLKALYLAEQMVSKELMAEFRVQIHAFYWRYLPEEKAATEPAAAPVQAN